MLDSEELMLDVEASTGAIRKLSHQHVAGDEVGISLGDLVDVGARDVRGRRREVLSLLEVDTLLAAANDGGDAAVVASMLGVASQVR
jgi:hypothetical protein